MSRFLIPGVMIVGGVAFGLTVLSALGDYLAQLTGSELLGNTIVLGPLLAGSAVLGWQIYGPAKRAEKG